MKRFFAFLQALILMFCLVSCAAISGNTPVAVPQSVSRGADAYVKPRQNEHTKEEKAVLDHYYGELISLYPRLAAIPREMLREDVSLDEYTNVKFVFCFGGLWTRCVFSFSSGPNVPEGKWTVSEDGFSRYYGRGLTEVQMSEIRSALVSSIGKFVDEKNLDGGELTEDNCSVYWRTDDGNIFATAEYIAYKTGRTTVNLGCGDHAHIFAKALVDLSSDDITFTVYPANGG